ncbi:hypothetical protein CJ204_10240 [Corynebacterium xerosis]|uniref:Amidohydrolase n=1 Tax=Corynebacterium xerosis TaxID=1725 RepID=A0A2N6SWX5_9CORY|nr:hypothetical protein [Corynebacterium xerosis]PMC61571.1 hypothetical protein CJ204_10240 [Corynebacterium xerosis]
MTANEAAAAILADTADTAAAREALYKDLHRHPELSMEDHRTSDVAHSCGHDVHVTAPPGEEVGAGARDMVDAGIVDKLPKPDLAFAQHVMGTIPGGAIGTRRGPVLTTASSIEITVHGADAFRTPYCYWGLGGLADMDSAPGNHSPTFAPDIQPTPDRGAQAIVVAACAWLAAD